MSVSRARSGRFPDLLLGIAVIVAFAACLTATGQPPKASGASQPQSGVPSLVQYARPMVFEANRGQADAGVRFVAHGSGYSLLLTDSEAVVALRGPADCPAEKNRAGVKPVPCVEQSGQAPDLVHIRLAGHSTDQRAGVEGANPAGEDALPGRVNYFLGNDPAKWRAGVPTFAKVRYSEIYPGVDLVFYGNRKQLEYDFVLSPGADPARIALQVSETGSVGASARIDAATRMLRESRS